MPNDAIKCLTTRQVTIFLLPICLELSGWTWRHVDRLSGSRCASPWLPPMSSKSYASIRFAITSKPIKWFADHYRTSINIKFHVVDCEVCRKVTTNFSREEHDFYPKTHFVIYLRAGSTKTITYNNYTKYCKLWIFQTKPMAPAKNGVLQKKPTTWDFIIFKFQGEFSPLPS